MHRSAVIPLVLALHCGLAQAERSRIDDEVGKPGECELELTRERLTARRAPTETSTGLQVDCGIGWQTELAVGHQQQRSRAEQTRSFSLEARTVLLDEGVAKTAWSLVYGVRAERIAGSWRRSGHGVALNAGWRPASGWVLEAQAGPVYERFERLWSWRRLVGLEHEVSDRLELRLELEDDNRSRPRAGIELRYEFWPDRARVNLLYDMQRGPARERLLGIGVTFEF